MSLLSVFITHAIPNTSRNISEDSDGTYCRHINIKQECCNLLTMDVVSLSSPLRVKQPKSTKNKKQSSSSSPIVERKQPRPSAQARASRDLDEILRKATTGQSYSKDDSEPSLWKDISVLAGAFNGAAGKQDVAPSSPIKKEAVSNADSRSYKVFDMNTINAPGVMYKSVVITTDTSCTEMIEQVLERFGCTEPAEKFELHYAVEAPPGTKKKKIEPARVLHPDDCPALVADWFTDKPRRFEVHRKEGRQETEKRNRKWSEYWSSPTAVRRSLTVKKRR
eukprot:m.106164 g.106164  ORF g.106164 m.106164 type:complete len:279 (+) comp13897_c0_seq6:22-858(+)